jgi:hypothetical protein
MSELDPLRLRTENLPGTFADRGVAVPFTTPMLAPARVRIPERAKTMEFVLPNPSGGKGRYILAWEAIQGMVTTTLHDRMLFKELTGQDVRTPLGVRQAGLDIAARGLACSGAAKAAKAALDSDEQAVTTTTYLMIVKLLQLAGLSASGLLSHHLSAEENRQRIRGAVTQVAEKLKIPPAEMYARLETLAALVAPVGLPDSPLPGRLRVLTQELETFANSLREWTGQSNAEIKALALYEAALADATSALSRDAIARIDGDLTAIAAVLQHWEARFEKVTVSLTRIQHLLDGWENMVTLWRDASDKEPAEQQSHVAEFFNMLPLLPRNEVIAGSDIDPDKQLDRLNSVQRRWVRANQDWRTGRIDYNRVKKIEALKAQQR